MGIWREDDGTTAFMCVKYARRNAPTVPMGIGTTSLVPVRAREAGWDLSKTARRLGSSLSGLPYNAPGGFTLVGFRWAEPDEAVERSGRRPLFEF